MTTIKEKETGHPTNIIPPLMSTITDNAVSTLTAAKLGLELNLPHAINTTSELGIPTPSFSFSNLSPSSLPLSSLSPSSLSLSSLPPSSLVSPCSTYSSLTPHSSIEDLSEYTDADETVSAPTELLSEFLSAVMMRDYESALKYCKLILQYEPDNATAREFYPLIVERIRHMNEDGSESEEDSSHSHTDGTYDSYSSLEDEEVSTTVKEVALEVDCNGNGKPSKCSQDDPFLGSSDSETATDSISQMFSQL